ncbi:hypothetical protein ADH76_35625 [Enterocloster clostridioformis]|nr:hypothetical protein A4V08_30545 [Lachnoclostridium sp. YL32]NDO31714.1 DUF4366 domain-containing protein [Enterocloster clostridioformis]OXE61058.1 hypothetical protein ADH76_35625 [Enterocloster clostridioformis]QQR04164.1 DUF4366 domain-containing protein [Enterocloster clostridioformis]
MAAGILSAAPMTAFAFTDEAAEVETPVVVEETTEETEPETGATPFSVPGNGQLLDDKTDDNTKQFLTIQTKNGNTFFLVLDRSSNTENVYMLSMIDENDLAEFIEDTEIQTEPETEMPQVVIPETEEEAVETEPETEAETQQEGMNMGALVAIALLLACGISGFYYLKVVKPKKDEDDTDGEDLEFYDGGEYMNEDQPEDSEDEEE